MIADYLAIENAGLLLREAMPSAPVPSLLLPEAIDGAVAADLRARLDAAGTTAFDLADRGRYRHNDALRIDPLWDELTGFAAGVAGPGATVTLAAVRWLRLGRGDYSLVKDDTRTRPAGPHLELVLDLSPGTSGEAELVYTDGLATLGVPQIAGLLAVVDRTATSTRYQRPPTVRGLGGIEIARVILSFVR